MAQEFQDSDANHDYVVSFNEYTNTSQSSGTSGHLKLNETEWTKFDTNDDGVMTLQEFTTLWLQSLDVDEKEEEPGQDFLQKVKHEIKRHDTDLDGSLSIDEELLPTSFGFENLTPLQINVTKEQVDYQRSKSSATIADRNGDGSLNISEYAEVTKLSNKTRTCDPAHLLCTLG